MSIERDFDFSLVAEMALREKQIQQSYRPIIGVHKWFARRPGTLFRGLILSEFGEGRLEDAFFRSNDLSGSRIADPFMGGGTPLIEANRVGCDVQGFDVNPMSAWVVREEIESLDTAAYERAARALVARLHEDVGRYYRTSCPLYGDGDVPVKSFLWVKVFDCGACGKPFDLFPGYLLSENRRHPKNVLVCPGCGDLNEVEDRKSPGDCTGCGAALRQAGPARRGRCTCPHCGYSNVHPGEARHPLEHRLFAIEYHNPGRRAEHKGRFFKKPDAEDTARMAAAAKRWQRISPRHAPQEVIPPGELCRYDTTALKSLDIFSVHGFPVGLVQCESNLLGIVNGAGANVGSGGWSNIIDKYVKAKRYCEAPFEVRRRGSRNVRIRVEGERIGEKRNGSRRSVSIRCASATGSRLSPRSLDAVFTDPPCFGNVQYGELMDFCPVWLRRLVGNDTEGFDRPSTRSRDESTGNVTQARGLTHFTEGLSLVWSRMAEALKPGAPLVFTYHHNKLDACCAVGVALLDAGLVCSASLPCPAEMGGSIHIHGTASSIMDTVFACRSSGRIPGRWLFDTPERLVEIAGEDRAHLAAAGRTPTHGDTRCIVFGHLTRMAVWKLRRRWNRTLPVSGKIAAFSEALSSYGDCEQLARCATAAEAKVPFPGPFHAANESEGEERGDVSF